MQFHVITLFPEAVRQMLGCGVTGRALKAGLASLRTWNPRDYAEDERGTVDDRPFGGGPGMVMMAEPVSLAIQQARTASPQGSRVVYLSPQGRPLNQHRLVAAARNDGLVLLCGRYEGIDERVLADQVDEEWSIGDYVLSGGELAAAVVMDALIRLLPGALGKNESAEQDSFMQGLLDCPHYTRPERWRGQPVPQVLRSGDHGAIENWRKRQALGRTWRRRPDLLARRQLSEDEQRLLQDYIDDYNSRPRGADEE
ncbi:MAG: tRNA (guanosine(37)-N1)-methyltransferase TrmD [Xanthomonadales bacterium]|nr:tRNA (guanosine(37)-N1)-methyltransferase TrmD [Xanthomonadales bacterium]